ncbi:Flavonoid 3',5'-hydroxylase [Spatholobus suberectus]|nr:Flavonoid 3',5'-hydroxylase [Spatholobus suberectus]
MAMVVVGPPQLASNSNLSGHPDQCAMFAAEAFHLFGYLPFLGTHPHLKFDKLTQVYGPIFKLMLGTKTFEVVTSPSLVKELVHDQDTIFANRDPPISVLVASYGGTDIASLPHGPQWRKARKILVREMLSNTNISNSFSHRRVEVKKSIKDVYEKKIGRPINVGELAFLTATNLIMSMIWGETLQAEKGTANGAEFRALVSELMVLLGKPNISDLFAALAWLDLQGIEKRTRKVSQWIDRLFDSAIEKRMNVTGKGENKSKKKDFLQYLLELTKSDSDSASMTMNEIKAILIVRFLV